MHGLQRCFLFAILVIYGSVFGRSERIRTNQHHRNNNRPTRSHRRYPSLLSFLSSVVAASGTSETSHIAALHRKLSVDGDAEDEDTDEDIPASIPVPSLSSSKSSVKVNAKRDNVGHNASKKIQVAKSTKKSPTVKDTTVERTPSGAHIYIPTYLVPIHTPFLTKFIPQVRYIPRSGVDHKLGSRFTVDLTCLLFATYHLTSSYSYPIPYSFPNEYFTYRITTGGDDDDNDDTKEVHVSTSDSSAGGGSFPAMSMVKQFAPTLVYMVASRYISKLDFTNPGIIQLCRVVFAVYLLLSQGKFHTRRKTTTVVLSYKQPSSFLIVLPRTHHLS